MKRYFSKKFFIISTIIFLAPILASAAKTNFSVWIPYWKKTEGAVETLTNLDKLNEINPFSYEVNGDGTLVDKMKISQEPWLGLFTASRQKKIRIVPTIAWSDGDAIHKILAVAKSRNEHINQIVKLVKENNFDGIEIDYENKKAETKPYFSRFIKDLAIKLHAAKKLLSCTIEARTPVSSRFSKIPEKLEYANDYAVLNLYCDRVAIMAYGQEDIDLKLNQKNKNELYAPVADIIWVKKVIGETLKSIKPAKLTLGVATYGYEYEVTSNSSKYDYNKIRSIGFRDASELAQKAGIAPGRNQAGELSFTYISSTSTRLVWFSDSQAIAEKIKWAKIFNLAGVAVFKIDGSGDPDIWKKL